MKNLIIDPYAVKDIQKQIDKVLRGLGNPDPPLNLNEVREILNLDRQFYSNQNTNALRESVSKLKVGAKQLIKRPSLLLDVVIKADIKALWIPDRKRILINESIPDLKKRHAEAHEIIHSITPHHRAFLFGDDSETLRSSCYEKLEAEANYGSGQLLFLRNKFVEMARDYPKDIASVKKLSKIFNNTITMTLWGLIEETHDNKPIFGIISQHPKYLSADFDPQNPCQYFVVSPAFRTQFGNVGEVSVFGAIKKYVSGAKAGPLGEGEAMFLGRDGRRHKFHMETFFNHYDALTIGTYLSPVSKQVVVQ